MGVRKKESFQDICSKLPRKNSRNNNKEDKNIWGRDFGKFKDTKACHRNKLFLGNF